MLQTPVARGNQSGVRQQRVFHSGGALSNPYGEHEGLASPLLPYLAEVVHVRIALSMIGAEHERRVADYQSRIDVGRVGLCNIANFGITRDETRTGAPHVLEQQFEESDAGHRASTHDDLSSRKLRRRASREEHHRPHW